MTASSKTQKEILILLATDFTKEHNASSLARELGITRVGTFKALKELEGDGLVKGKKFGKSTFYSVDLNDNYTRKNLEILLIEKARQYPRWLDEFKDLCKQARLVILFGSILRDEDKAKDIDLLMVLDKDNNAQVNSLISGKNQILTKKIHAIKQTEEDFRKNIGKQDKIVISAIRYGVVLCGYDLLMEAVKNAASRK